MRLMGIEAVEGHVFQFTRNWFLNRNLATFRDKVLPRWKGRPILYLELGVFEGMSMTWMLQHVLTNTASRAVGIDPWLETTKLDGDFMEIVMKRAHNNIKIGEGRCQLIRGNSAEILRKMCGKGDRGVSKNSVDVCMIDGNHNDLAVLDDARHCLQLVKPGGWLLFDDVENDIDKQRHVKDGLALFLAESQDKVRLLWKHGYVECFEKV